MRPQHLLSTAILFTLALTGIANSSAQSHSNGTTPYVYSTDTFPPYRATIVRHTLRLAIPNNSQSISALKLTAPAGFTLNRKVEVFDNKTGTKLPVSVNVDRQTIELKFDRSVAPGTAIDVELNNVRVWGADRNYDLAAKFTGDRRNASSTNLQVAPDRYINLGTAELRRY
jgi:hypothetical protein